MPPKLQLAIGAVCVVAAVYCGIKGIREQLRTGDSFLFRENLTGWTEQTRVSRKSRPGSFWYAVILWSVVALLVLAYGVALMVEAWKKMNLAAALTHVLTARSLPKPTMSTKPIPDGYSSVTPYLIIKGAGQAIDFYQRIFGARERMRLPGPGGMIMHAEIELGGSVIMLAGEFPQMGAVSPQTLGGSPVFLHLYVPDADAMFAKALAAGAKCEQPMENKFYGDRSGTLLDPFGHRWTLATHVEDVTPEEIGRRLAAMKPSC